MTVLSPADYADTGQWRLIIRIYKQKLTAVLEHYIHADVEPVTLFETKWDEEENSLEKIEDAIYKHPRVLDDFATRIEIFEDKVLFIPTELIEEGKVNEEDCYRKIYPSAKEDIVYERNSQLTAAYNPGKGLKNFLARTFSGARLNLHLLKTVTEKIKLKKAGFNSFVEFREGECDIIILSGEKLISAATYKDIRPEYMLCFLLSALKAFEIEPREVSVFVKGNPEMSGLQRVPKGLFKGISEDENNQR